MSWVFHDIGCGTPQSCDDRGPETIDETRARSAVVRFSAGYVGNSEREWVVQRLSPQDASFLHLEDEVSHMHIGSVAILEGPPPSYEAVSRMVRAHLPGVPRYRQKVHFVPIALGRPVWVDDPHFNLGYHLRRTALPPPGGDEELRNLVGRVMSQQLDRSKPLWEMWIIEGLSEGRWGFITKLHHCMVDGVSGTELLAVILDSERDPELADPDELASRAPAIGRGAGGPSACPTGGQSIRAAARRAVRRALAGPCDAGPPPRPFAACGPCPVWLRRRRRRRSTDR